jgi:hypothetical protein
MIVISALHQVLACKNTFYLGRRRVNNALVSPHINMIRSPKESLPGFTVSAF